MNETQRVVSPQVRKDWAANSESFLAEEPLLLNPEIDNPEDYFDFRRDGRIYAIDDNIRGNTTIDLLTLNRPELISKRKNSIDSYSQLFEKQLDELIKLYNPEQDKGLDPLLNLALKVPFENLQNQAKPEAEYSLLGRYMINNFDLFFVDPLEDANQKKILQQAYNTFIPEKKRTKTVDASKTSSKPLLKKVIIEELKIDHIKCFDNAVIKIKPNSTLILGINGRGKSTILQLLALGLSGVGRPGFANDWTDVIKAESRNAGFEISIKMPDDDICTLKFTVDENDRIECIENAERYLSIKNSLLILAYGTARNIKRSTVRTDKNFDSIASLFGINSSLKHIGDSKTYSYTTAGFDQVKKVINKLFKLADPGHLIELDSFDTETFYFKTPTNPESLIPLESMSDGFKSMFVWLFDMIIRAWEKGVDIDDTKKIAGIVMIDEIDNHLHPGWQRSLLPALEETFPNIQFIITSHSPFLVQSMRENNIILLSLNGDGVDAKTIPLEGKPYGYEIEKIIELAMGIENSIPEISDWLFKHFKEYEKAVEDGNKENVTALYKEIKSVIPGDSSFKEYLEIMGAGLLLRDKT
ncbi:MAG: AAA family ATPase [bacterium]|nr:AAA family ATPase [bacterium]